MTDWIRPEAQALAPELTATRRHLHQNPELSFEEHETTAFITARLKELGLEVKHPTPTGAVAEVGHGAGPLIALRADIDALPIVEENAFDFVSRRPGVMHACGHDGHTAILLGAAKLLKQHEHELPGRVRLLFQPAEELPPGGAQQLIQAGALEGVAGVLGLHLWSSGPTCRVGLVEGPAMAAADRFTITIEGRGGHGAAPHETVDAVVVGSQVVNALQTIVARRVNPLRPAVVTVGTFNAGFTFNVIAERAELKGTVRTFDVETQDLIEAAVHQLTEEVCRAHGARCQIEYNRGYPALINPAGPTRLMRDVVREAYGPEALMPQDPVMGGEDFAYYLQKKPGCFFFLGVGNEALGSTVPHHNPRFTLDEAALPMGVELMVRGALRMMTDTGWQAA